MRIAFLTPEYPSELPDGGGLGAYVHRMARLLVDSGHEAEVFVTSYRASGLITYDGVQTHRVNWMKNHPVLHLLSAGSSKLLRLQAWRRSIEWIERGKALATALEQRHAIAPFAIVQSADYLATGLQVIRRPDRVHVVRCSSAADLYNEFDCKISTVESCRGFLERWSMRRADVVYSPSRYIAEHFRCVHNINVGVLRPPAYIETSSSSAPPFTLPERFFVHFGQLMKRKGTTLLAAALPIAWKRAPDLTMVWSGHFWENYKLEDWRSSWGAHAEQVHVTGPLTRPDLYAVLRRADVAVLPSQVDNLPNTVIESLMFGVPVLGSRGASVDELVEEGRTGHLVGLGDVDGLAEALATMWLKNSPVVKGFKWSSDIAQAMQPERAVANLLGLAAPRAFLD
jgi:glycogen synthase